MILGDLFESRMSDLDIEYQDWKNMSPVAFHSRYKMTKEQWYHRYQSLIPVEGGIHEDAEYDDEAGMAHTNLRTTARAVQGLLDTIDNRENLPEWVQEKIAKAEAMLVSAWDYLLSQEEQGIDPRIAESTEELSVGDSVIIQGTEYNGKTGDVKEFSPSGKFVVVDLYNYGPQAFHLSNVKYNEYADKDVNEDAPVADLTTSTTDQTSTPPDRGFGVMIKISLPDLRIPDTARAVWEALQVILPRDYLPVPFRRATGNEQQARVIKDLRSDGFAIVKQNVGSEDIAQTIANKFEGRGIPAEVIDSGIYEQGVAEEQDACYRKVKSRYKVWPSAYASGALVQCRKKGAANWGNKSKK